MDEGYEEVRKQRVGCVGKEGEADDKKRGKEWTNVERRSQFCANYLVNTSRRENTNVEDRAFDPIIDILSYVYNTTKLSVFHKGI